MTLNGAIKQLRDLRSAEDMPIYYKPAIAEVINVLLMDTQEIRHGHWIDVNGDGSLWRCSVCGETQCCDSNYCGDCGAKMDAGDTYSTGHNERDTEVTE